MFSNFNLKNSTFLVTFMFKVLDHIKICKNLDPDCLSELNKTSCIAFIKHKSHKGIVKSKFLIKQLS
jgi:hypothetical protein